MLQRIRNPLHFALAMAIPGIAAVLLLFLPDSYSWDQSGWIAFLVAVPAYIVLYALASFVSFVLASLLLRRFASIAKRHLTTVGLIAGCLYVLGGYLTDPLWPEIYFLAAWFGLALAASFFVLLRWGESDG